MYSRIVVNSNVNIVSESKHWKTDWLKYCGTSYANVVKKNMSRKTCNRKPCQGDKVISGTVVNNNCTRVRNNSHSIGAKNPNLEPRVTKASDVAKPLRQKHVGNSQTSACEAPISMHNRFNILSHIDTFDTNQSHVLKNSNGKQVVQSLCQNSGACTSKHTVEKVNKPIGELKKINTSGVVQTMVSRLKNHCGDDLSDTNHRRDVILIETEDKYDLELRFCPKHRSKISEAKNITTFRNLFRNKSTISMASFL